MMKLTHQNPLSSLNMKLSEVENQN